MLDRRSSVEGASGARRSTVEAGVPRGTSTRAGSRSTWNITTCAHAPGVAGARRPGTGEPGPARRRERSGHEIGLQPQGVEVIGRPPARGWCGRLAHHQPPALGQEGSRTLGGDQRGREAPGHHGGLTGPPDRIVAQHLGPAHHHLHLLAPSQPGHHSAQPVGPALAGVEQRDPSRGAGRGDDEAREPAAGAEIEDRALASPTASHEAAGMSERLLDRTGPEEASGLGVEQRVLHRRPPILGRHRQPQRPA